MPRDLNARQKRWVGGNNYDQLQSAKLKQDWKAFYLAPFPQIVDYLATYVFTLSVYNLLIMSVHKYIPNQKFEMKHSVLLKKFKMG